MSSFQGKFEGFWTDTDDAVDRVNLRLEENIITPDEAQLLISFISNGYVVLENAISEQTADSIVNEINSVSENPGSFIVRSNRASYSYATKDAVEDNRFRLIDFHVNSLTAQQAQFAEKVERFLSLVFEEDILAFQSLTFTQGSQQGVHQDGAYVVVDKPLKFAASWIALEDVDEGSGELMYFPGSHKLPDYLFSSEHKSWLPARDGQEAGAEYLSSLKDRIKEAGLAEERFLPKKGDALIWAADLAHGGSKVEQETTRYSLVTHYCPLSVSPNYKTFSKNFAVKKVSEKGSISSRHYDLNEEDNIDPQKKSILEKFGLARSKEASNAHSLKKPTFMGKLKIE